MKRILAFFLALVITLWPGQLQVFAEETDTGGDIDVNEGAAVLGDGAYCVPLSVRCNLQNHNENQSLIWDKYREALVEVKDGQFTVTLRIGNVKDTPKETEGIKILKENYSAADIAYNGFQELCEASIWENEDYWRTDDINFVIDERIGYKGTSRSRVEGYY